MSEAGHVAGMRTTVIIVSAVVLLVSMVHPLLAIASFPPALAAVVLTYRVVPRIVRSYYGVHRGA